MKAHELNGLTKNGVRFGDQLRGEVLFILTGTEGKSSPVVFVLFFGGLNILLKVLL